MEGVNLLGNLIFILLKFHFYPSIVFKERLTDLPCLRDLGIPVTWDEYGLD